MPLNASPLKTVIGKLSMKAAELSNMLAKKYEPHIHRCWPVFHK